MGYRSLVQIALIILGFVLVFVYIKPTFETISTVQDERFEYANAVAKAEEFNSRLDELVRDELSFSQQQRTALDIFMPVTLDTAQVMRDLEVMLAGFDVIIGDISVSETVTPVEGVMLEGSEVVSGEPMQYQDFSLSFNGSYEEAKEALALLEANAYPLEVVELSIDRQLEKEDESLTAGDVFEFSMTLRVYTLSLVTS